MVEAGRKENTFQLTSGNYFEQYKISFKRSQKFRRREESFFQKNLFQQKAYKAKHESLATVLGHFFLVKE